MKRIFLLAFFICVFFCDAVAFDTAKALLFEDTVLDIGQIVCSSGPKTCSFVAVNKSGSPLTISKVTSSCGCTTVRFPRESIAPGAKVTISVEYANDEGPIGYFDKTLTVYVSGFAQPLRLHLRGIAQKEAKPDSEVYTHGIGGTLAMLPGEIKLDNILQGCVTTGQSTVVNLGNQPATLNFKDCTPELKLRLSPNPVPAGAHASLFYTVSSNESKWGYNNYSAQTVVNGKPSDKTLNIKVFTQENFSSLSRSEKLLGSWPVFEESTFSFGKVKKGTRLTAKFKCTNKGKKDFVVHKVDYDNAAVHSLSAFPAIPPASCREFTLSLNTESLPVGEALLVVTLTTNSALRPVVTLFLAGWID